MKSAPGESIRQKVTTNKKKHFVLRINRVYQTFRFVLFCGCYLIYDNSSHFNSYFSVFLRAGP